MFHPSGLFIGALSQKKKQSSVWISERRLSRKRWDVLAAAALIWLPVGSVICST